MIKKRSFKVFLILCLFFIAPVFFPVILAYGNNPNDQYLMDQWGWLSIYTDVAYANGYRGDNTTIVAVIDTGIDWDHPDLQANIFNNTADPIGGGDEDFNGFIDDIHGWNFVDGNNDTRDHDSHGSHCAGIIAAIDNTIGVCGVAPDVQILPIKVIEVDTGDMSILDDAIDYAVLMGADVISMSIGSNDDPIAFGVINTSIETAYAAGIVLVAAAGNDGDGVVDYPACHPDVIAVAAVNKRNERASYSDYGPHIEISAPGGDSSGLIKSTGNESNYYSTGGTSMACPHVAGVIALLLQWNNTLTPDQVRQRIADTAIDLGTTGWDQFTGEGLINVAGCLGLPMSHVYNPIIDWIIQNWWWLALAGAGILILVIYAAVKKPKTATTTYYETSIPDYY